MWKPVVGYEEIYEVRPGRDGGRVRRVAPIKRSRVGKELFNICSLGYARVVLSKPNSKPKYVRIHTLILEAFVGPKPKRAEACHADDIKMNNTLDNLYWGSRSDNINDAIFNGGRTYPEKKIKILNGYAKGETHGMSKLTNKQRKEIVLQRIAGVPRKDLAAKYKVSTNQIYRIFKKYARVR